jgi:hypothetical protein
LAQTIGPFLKDRDMNFTGNSMADGIDEDLDAIFSEELAQRHQDRVQAIAEGLWFEEGIYLDVMKTEEAVNAVMKSLLAGDSSNAGHQLEVLISKHINTIAEKRA